MNKYKKNGNFLLLILLLLIFFSACSSLQKDLIIDSSKSHMELNLLEIEKMIIPLEAVGGVQARRQQTEMAAARRMMSDTEKEAAADADFSGRLIAWSGRLAILEGKYSDAQRLYRQSVALSPGNIPAIILGIRLEGDPEKRLELIEAELALAAGHSAASGYGELHIEKGRALAESRRLSESVASFDTAFVGLDTVYRESYQEIRDRAWELRNADYGSAGIFDILTQGGINWKDSITLAKTETRLLHFLSGGRDMSVAELFNRLYERSFIPATQDITLNNWPAGKPSPDDIVTRAGAAWLIWHLYAESRADRGLLSRYSARYAIGANPRSPLADVPALSPFFDSILGCVETELLSLPDGRNFRGTEPMRGAELLSVLKKFD